MEARTKTTGWHLRFRRRAAAEAWAVKVPPRLPPLALPDPTGYPADVRAKAERVREVLERHLPDRSDALSVVPSPDCVHYHHRVQFPIRHREESRVEFVVFDPETEEEVSVEQYPIASKRINVLMRRLLSALGEYARARDGSRRVEFISNLEGGALARVVYNRPLDAVEDQRLADTLAEVLDASIILQAKGQRICCSGRSKLLVQTNRVPCRTGLSEFSLRDCPQHLMDSTFFQANVRLNREMQCWVASQTLGAWPPESDMLELFCGNGNFTLPAAGNFRRVLAIETCARSLSAAAACAEQAGVANVDFLELKAEESTYTGGKKRTRRFGRFNFAALLVDPPRGGLDERTLDTARTFQQVIYVSCNPVSLAEDLDRLPELRVAAACLFDQFPWTDHAEVAVRLERG